LFKRIAVADIRAEADGSAPAPLDLGCRCVDLFLATGGGDDISPGIGESEA
jgi:hypothetical protein